MIDKATIIFQCFNVESYIQECLDHIAHRGYVVNYIYLVDNN